MAEREFFANNAVSSLNGAINSSTTTVVLTSGTAFPAKQFRLIIDDEIMYVVSRSTNTLTVIRGYEGTTAASHADLAPAASIYTAGALEQVKLDMKAMLGLGRKPLTGNTYGDEFDDDNFSGWTLAIPSGFTVNTIERDYQASVYSQKPSASFDGELTCYLKDTVTGMTAGDYIEVGTNGLYGNQGYPMWGVCASDTNVIGSGQQISWLYDPREDAVIMRRHSTSGGTGDYDYRNFDPSFNGKFLALRLKYLGSYKWEGSISMDGIQWMTQVTNVNPGGSTNTINPRYIGFCITPWSNSCYGICSFSYFRTSF